MSVSVEEHTVQEPAWVKALVEGVLLEAFQPLGFIGPLGYRWWEPGSPSNAFEGWQIAVFPTPNEVKGPVAQDGCRYVSGFRLDVGRIIGVMTSVDMLVWAAPAQYNGDLDGPEVSLRGMFVGKRVWLRVFHLPPPDEPTSFYVNPQTGEAWEKTA